jgi:hypothetical protein
VIWRDPFGLFGFPPPFVDPIGPLVIGIMPTDHFANPFLPTYGNFCGKGNNGFLLPPIRDGGTDACCKDHDECWQSGWVAGNKNCEEQSIEQLRCDSKMCKCLRDAKPVTDPEKTANTLAQNLFCNCYEL